MTKDRTVLIFGYPLAIQHLGGLVWIKKVVNYIDKSGKFCVKKISCSESSLSRFPFVSDIHAVLRGVFSNPAIAMLDTYGEATIWMWFLLRLLRPRTKIVKVFNHYEPLSVRHMRCTRLRSKYYALIDLITKIMLRNSDKIITVSNASLEELRTLVEIKFDKKIAVVGCSCTAYSDTDSNGTKDIDFLCIGRIEKFSDIASIWEEIRKIRPASKFVMAGSCSSNDLGCLRSRGIDHLGIVSDDEKMDLYRRAKVFLFPSMFEGFGIAVGEALSARMIVITWKIPAFEERFPGPSNINLRLVKIGDKELFIKYALKAIDSYDRSDLFQISTENLGISKTWDEVGKNVVNALEMTIN